MSPRKTSRTWFTTLLAIATIVLGGLGTLFSAFALLLAIGSPYANASTTALDIFLIFLLPPLTLITGIGLLLRWRIARWGMILLMAGIVAFGVKGLVAPSGQKTPDYDSDSLKQYLIVQSAACIGLGTLLLLGLISPTVRREFNPSTPPPPMHHQWRVGHSGRDMMYYEEHHNGEWQRISIDGEMLTGRAHHVIYFADEETWQRYPEWARHRREEIIARIKSSFREPDYEYAGGGTASSHAATPPADAPAIPSKSDGTILPMLAFLISVAAICFWFAAEGIRRGETRLPARSAANHRVIRSEKPALFWSGIGLLGTLGAASTGTAAWLVIHRIRHPR